MCEVLPLFKLHLHDLCDGKSLGLLFQKILMTFSQSYPLSVMEHAEFHLLEFYIKYIVYTYYSGLPILMPQVYSFS